jgi:hypothetical protein
MVRHLANNTWTITKAHRYYQMQRNYSVVYVHVKHNSLQVPNQKPPAVKHLLLFQKWVEMLKIYSRDISLSWLL